MRFEGLNVMGTICITPLTTVSCPEVHRFQACITILLSVLTLFSRIQISPSLHSPKCNAMTCSMNQKIQTKKKTVLQHSKSSTKPNQRNFPDSRFPNGLHNPSRFATARPSNPLLQKKAKQQQHPHLPNADSLLHLLITSPVQHT